MPTIFTHPAVAIALRPRHLLAGTLLTVLPDIDVLAFRFGIPYGSTFGHRGFTHSILFAAIAAAIATVALRSNRRTFALLFVCAVSHGVLDTMTDGGRGIAFFSPFSNHRYFLPWRPIRVSPIGGIDFGVLWSEVRWVWLPAMAVAAIGAIRRRLQRARSPVPGKAGW
ncbi:MAG: metal-dependent hydrolase [Acidobacteriota bacterium]